MQKASQGFLLVFLFVASVFANAAAEVPRRGAQYIFRHGTVPLLASKRIGPQGGTLEAVLPSPHAGNIRVEIQAGALERETDVFLSLDPGFLQPRAGKWSGLCVNLSAANVVSFNQPVRLIVPFKPEGDEVLVGYYVDNDGSLDAIDFGPSNAKTGTATFVTLRPGRYTWISTK